VGSNRPGYGVGVRGGGVLDFRMVYSNCYTPAGLNASIYPVTSTVSTIAILACAATAPKAPAGSRAVSLDRNFRCKAEGLIWLNQAIPLATSSSRTYVRVVPSAPLPILRTYVLFHSDIGARAASPRRVGLDPCAPPARGRRSSRLGGRPGWARTGRRRVLLGSGPPRAAARASSTTAGGPGGAPAAGVPLPRRQLLRDHARRRPEAHRAPRSAASTSPQRGSRITTGSSRVAIDLY
jgi:hypothetical protein